MFLFLFPKEIRFWLSFSQKLINIFLIIKIYIRGARRAYSLRACTPARVTRTPLRGVLIKRVRERFYTKILAPSPGHGLGR